MSKQLSDKIEYLVMLVAEFAARHMMTDAQAYRFLSRYGAFKLCAEHYNVMHTLSVEDNIQTLTDYCLRKGGRL